MVVRVEVMRSCVIPYFFMQTVYGFYFFFNEPVPFFLSSSSTGYMCFYDTGFLLPM